MGLALNSRNVLLSLPPDKLKLNTFLADCRLELCFKVFVWSHPADILVRFRVKSNVKQPNRSTKKVGEKRRKRGKTIEKQKKKWGGGRNREGKTDQEKEGKSFLVVVEFHLFRLNSERCYRICVRIIFYFLSGRDGSCHTLISAGRNAQRPLEQKAVDVNCDAPFCHDSIIEGHSFTITVGL